MRFELALLLLHLGQSKVGYLDQRPLAEPLVPHQYIRRLSRAVVIAYIITGSVSYFNSYFNKKNMNRSQPILTTIAQAWTNTIHINQY